MSQVDPIRCFNGFYMGVKVQSVPSDVQREFIFMEQHPPPFLFQPATRKKLLKERLSAE